MNRRIERIVKVGSLALEIENLDAARGRRAEPVPVRAEDQSVDHVAGLKGVEVLSVIEIPEHGNAILATRGSKRAIGGDRDRVDVASVAVVVCPELALGELPDLAKSGTSVTVRTG